MEIECPICGRLCKNRRSLASHRSVHENIERCPECGLRYARKAMATHKRMAHDSKIRCSRCNNGWQYRDDLCLQCWLAMHGKTIQCADCGRDIIVYGTAAKLCRDCAKARQTRSHHLSKLRRMEEFRL